MNESSLWTWLRDVALPLGQYDRIESHDTAPGFPDVHYNVDWNSGTMELKYSQNPNAKKPFRIGGLRPAQKKWHQKATEQGADCWIIAEVPSLSQHSYKSSNIYIIHGCAYDVFNDATHQDLSDLSAAVVHREDPKNAAKILQKILTSPEDD